jgi:hypothetical protein
LLELQMQQDPGGSLRPLALFGHSLLGQTPNGYWDGFNWDGFNWDGFFLRLKFDSKGTAIWKRFAPAETEGEAQCAITAYAVYDTNQVFLGYANLKRMPYEPIIFVPQSFLETAKMEFVASCIKDGYYSLAAAQWKGEFCKDASATQWVRRKNRAKRGAELAQ